MIKKTILNLIRKTGYDLIKYDSSKGEYPGDFMEEHKRIIQLVRPYTMTTVERIFAVIEAAKHISLNQIEGSVVECGVWRGGSMMAIASTLISCGDTGRELYLYDTYEGMPQPKSDDVSYLGVPAQNQFEETKFEGRDASSWCFASLEDVQSSLKLTGYDQKNIRFVKGKVEETIPSTIPEKIALLRLDTDWYDSTRHELIHLFPRLVRGGVLIIDDYGHWQGARKAVDEYIKENNLQILLNRIDYTGRIAVKL